MVDGVTVEKPGHPAEGEEPRELLTKITFKADLETLRALMRLEREVAKLPGIRRVRSTAIRRALIETAARIPK